MSYFLVVGVILVILILCCMYMNSQEASREASRSYSPLEPYSQDASQSYIGPYAQSHVQPYSQQYSQQYSDKYPHQLNENNNILDDLEIYVINLKSRPQKRENIERQFLNQNMSGFIFDAIDGKKLDLHELEANNIISPNSNKHNKKRQLRRGEIGCSMSHTTLWDMLLNSDKKYFLVFEDDAVLVDDFQNKLADLLNELKDKKWDVLYLNENCIRHFGKEACNGPSYTENTFRPKNIGYGLYGYVMTKDFLRKVNDIRPFIEPLDNYMIIKADENPDIVLLRSKEILVDFDKGFASDTTLIK